MTTSTTCSPTADWQDKEWDKFREWISGVLKQTTMQVTFTKKDGTERVMNCTLSADLLPPVVVTEDKKERKISENSIAVYDTDLKEWRSFIIKSVKKIDFTLGE